MSRRLSLLIGLFLLLGRVAPAFGQPGLWISQGGGCTGDTRLTSPITGQTYCFDQVSNSLKQWNGTAWADITTTYPLPVSKGGTGLTASPITVPLGGTGATSLTLNGVLFGNTAGAVQVTAQGPANSVLTANAGSPVFSNNPIVAGLTIVTTPLNVPSGGTGLSSLAATRIPYGNGASAYQSSAGLIFDGTNFTTTGTVGLDTSGRLSARADCTTLSGPGKEACLDETRNVWLHYDGTGWQSDAALATKIVNADDSRWGAKHDGVTDDSAALQSAFNYANTNGYLVYLPPKGTTCYKTTSQLVVSLATRYSGFGIVGSGPSSCINFVSPRSISTVTGMDNGNPVKITTSGAHGLSTGDVVRVAELLATVGGVTANSSANGRWTVTVTDATHFTVPVAGNGVYVSGGLVGQEALFIDGSGVPGGNGGVVRLSNFGVGGDTNTLSALSLRAANFSNFDQLMVLGSGRIGALFLDVISSTWTGGGAVAGVWAGGGAAMTEALRLDSAAGQGSNGNAFNSTLFQATGASPVSVNVVLASYGNVFTGGSGGSSATGVTTSGTGGPQVFNNFDLTGNATAATDNATTPSAWLGQSSLVGGGRFLFKGIVELGDTVTPLIIGTGTNRGTVAKAALTASRTWTFPDVTGNVITSGDTGTVTNTMLTGQASAAHGGTGIDSSASTGAPIIDAGVWSVSAAMTTNKGGTAQNTSAWSGIPTINAGTWTQNNVLTASQILYGAAANTVASSASFLFDGTNFKINTTTPLISLGASANGNGSVYISQGNTINSEYSHNASDSLWLNYHGYQDGATQTRDLVVGDGKQNRIATFDSASRTVGIGTTTFTNLNTNTPALVFGATLFINLPAAPNGTILYCSDCDPPTVVVNACANAGAKTGAMAVRINGAWECIG